MSVRIVGGGLSGLSAAIQLARRGASVEVFERRSHLRSAPEIRCDAVENWTTADDFSAVLSDWAIDASLFHRVSSIDVVTFDGERHALAQPRPMLYLVKRGGEPGCLDRTLELQALDLGVRIHHGRTLPREQADVWAVGSSRGGFFLDVGITFRTSQPNRAVILFDERLAPKACAYLIVIDGVATLAVLLTRQFRLARALLRDTLAAFQRIRPFDVRDVRLRAGFGGALNALGARPSAPLVVGEAAGFLDYLWGFGIRHAMLSGSLAARALLEGGDYESLVAREIRPLVQSSLINRKLYDRAGNRAYRALIRYLCAKSDLHGGLRRAYRSPTVRRLFWPWVARSLSGGMS
ncbi:MAG TPA: NAD(P)/FAD-dependent oxidoreductase [Burkholderiales bacterium]|nr:NAD(P)/FAD-dependent oxidoreductase [Burkholderiales bacterium]